MGSAAQERCRLTAAYVIVIAAWLVALLLPTMVSAQSVITCPSGTITKCIQSSSEVCVNLPVTGQDSVVCSTGTWSGGQLCFSAPEGAIFTHRVIAYSGATAETCTVSVDVRFGVPPTLICPAEPFILEVCEPGPVCFSVPVKNATKVSALAARVASWSNGTVCVNVDTSGFYTTLLIASNDCGSDTCLVSAQVTVKSKPVVECPREVVDSACALPEQVCVPAVITGQDSVHVPFGNLTPGGKYCFTADTAGLYHIPLTAYNHCGASMCTLSVLVQKFEAPVISCPEGIQNVEVCGPQQVCIPVDVRGAEIMHVSGGKWVDGHVCFDVTKSGLHSIVLSAENFCDIVTCSLAVNVTVKSLPTITCPLDTIAVNTCDSNVNVAVNLGFENADSVTAKGGTWSDGVLNFKALSDGYHTFPFTAYNSCGTAECSVTVHVTFPQRATIECPPDRRTYNFCPGSPVSITLPAFTGAIGLDVFADTSSAGTYDITIGTGMHGSFLLPTLGPETQKITSFRVVAHGQCNTATCTFAVHLGVGTVPHIACPAIEGNVSLCRPGTVCVPLAITGASTVRLTGGGSWANDTLCFTADSSGAYSHKIYATSECGTDSCEILTFVHITKRPVACFTPQIAPGASSLEVAFHNCSTPESVKCLWLFGDGDTSTVFSPSHTYVRAGCYTVGLRVYDTCNNYSTLYDTVCVSGGHIVIPTDQWINAYCDKPTFNGTPLKPGDVIEAYDPTRVLCGMSMVNPDGSFGFMPIYRDDPTTPVDEGASVGDVISFTLNGVPVFTNPVVIWTANGDAVQVCQFSTQSCRSIHLKRGWNLISWNVEYSAPIQDAIRAVRGCVDVILGFDQRGLTYDPANEEFSTLLNVDYHSGYWFLMKCDTTLQLCGIPINSLAGITIYNGWNLVSYWPETNLAVADALSSIILSVPLVYSWDDMILVWLKDGTSFNTLVDMRPLFGYWISSTSEGVLKYPGFAGSAAVPIVAATPSTTVVPSREWISIYGKNIKVDGNPLAAGATVEAFSGGGGLCGSGTYDGTVLKFTPIYGNDAAVSAAANYPKAGEQVTLKVNGTRAYPPITWTTNGDRKKIDNLSLSPTGVEETVPITFALEQNYPNPFNPTTTIGFSIPTNSQVRIEIFNVTGQCVRTLADRPFEAGQHQVQWDATDGTGKPVAGGMYLYRLTAGSFVESRKMMLLK